MKKVISVVVIFVMLITCLASCQKKQKPVIKIKHESVTSVEFKKAVSSKDVTNLEYVQKEITKKQDVENVLDWIESLKLDKHGPIEIPVEKVQYVIILNAIKNHKLIIMDNYVIYDSQAYTFENPDDRDLVDQKYNLLNYPEKDTVSTLV